MFSIITPSLRQLPWLKRCVRSVADQGVKLQHIIQDGGSGGELEEWVRGFSGAELKVEADTGIYDALNRGFSGAKGEILAFLNCDEQYLPGTLRKVEETFAAEPALDMVVGDYLVVNGSGNLRSYHRATPLRRSMVLTDHLYDYTCTFFFRRRLWEASGGFRTDFRALGDAEWAGRILQSRPRIRYLGEFTSAFALTEGNVSQLPAARAEEARLKAVAPWWARGAAPVLRQWRHVEKLLRGGYTAGAIDYQIYVGEEESRRHFHVERPSSKHPWAA